MRPREAAGFINRAPQCYVYCRYSTEPDGEIYMAVTRVQAKAIVDHARDNDVEDLDIEVNKKGEVFIGDEIELDVVVVPEPTPGPG